MYAETVVTAVDRCCLDQVRLAIGLEVWTLGECSVWESMRRDIGAITLGDGLLEPFGLLKLYWMPSTPWGGRGFPGSPLETDYSDVVYGFLMVGKVS